MGVRASMDLLTVWSDPNVQQSRLLDSTTTTTTTTEELDQYRGDNDYLSVRHSVPYDMVRHARAPNRTYVFVHRNRTNE